MVSKLKKITLPLLFFGFLVLYIHNLSRSVYGGDVGDLVSAAYFFGVPHPPGYPFFTFLGFLLIHVFPFFPPAFAVGLISAISGAVGIVCLYLITKQVTKNTFVACIAALIVGCTYLYWLYAEVAEVFELNVAFALLLFLLAIIFRQTKKPLILFVFFFVLGLSCTHHETIVLIFPSLFLLIGKNLFLASKKNPINLLWIGICFLLGLSPFIYIFVASSHNPIINWDAVHDLQSFFHLVLRKDYGTFQAGIFGSPPFSQRFVTLQVYFQYIVFQLTIPVLFCIIVGFVSLFKKDKLLFISLLLAWIISGPAFLAYAGFPLTGGFIIGAYERFILLSMVIVCIPFGVGLVTFSQFLARFLPKRNYPLVFQSLFLFIPLMLFIYNYPKTNLSHVFIGDTYAKDYLESLPKNAILIISGDTQVFNTWYVHDVLGVRSDVLVYNIGAVSPTNNIIGAMLAGVSQKDRPDELVSVLEKLPTSQPIFSTFQFQGKKGPKIAWIPYGLSYQMIVDKDQLPSKNQYQESMRDIWKQLHTPTHLQLQNAAYHNLTISEITNYYGDGLVAAGTFLYTQYRDTQAALSFYHKATAIAPENPKGYEALGIVYATKSGECSNAAQNLSTAISLDPYQEISYFLLYNVYISCFHNQKLANAVIKEFNTIFQKDFKKELKSSLSELSDPLQF